MPAVTIADAVRVSDSQDTKAVLQADSTTQYFLPPRMTTPQKNAIASPAEGAVVFDTDLNYLSEYTGAVWQAAGGGTTSGAPSTATYITQTADAGLSAEQALSALATGLAVVTTATGVISTVAAPGGAVVGTTDTQVLTNKTLTQFKLTDATTLTIATGAITRTQGYHKVDTEAAAATDDLDTISGGAAGDRLTIVAANTARTVVIRHIGGGTGNIRTFSGSSITLDETYKSVELLYDGTNWNEIGVSSTGGITKVVANGTYTPGAAYTTNSTSMVDVDATNVAQTVTLNGSGVTFVTFTFRTNKVTAGNGFFRITDGTNSSNEIPQRFVTNNDNTTTCHAVFDALAAGSTTFKLQYRSSDANNIQIIVSLPITWSVCEIK